MRVELDVDLRPAKPAPGAAERTVVDPEALAKRSRSRREERFLRRVALASVIEDAVATGEFRDLAHVARRCRVSRARVSAVVSRVE